jgi:hypothetical protein
MRDCEINGARPLRLECDCSGATLQPTLGVAPLAARLDPMQVPGRE